jgi:nitrogen fixation/metabolism regulation signal transduction histidine kinase
MKKYQLNILLRIAFLVITITGMAFLWVKGWGIYAVLLVFIIVFQVFDLFKFINKSNIELEQFVESIHYRDFTRHFDVNNAPEPVKDLRKGFNEINTTFKLITKEKETQFIYLQKILELVDTGILSYETQTGDVIWMNDAFKKMTGIPYLKTIHSLEKRTPSVYQDVIALKPRENKITNITTDKNTSKILITATAFQSDNKIYKLIAFQNINEVVDKTEAQAWRKLLSVMTHEIMNSIAPITSLADTLKKNITHLNVENTSNNNFEDLELGIETIRKRSEGLLKFAETYRNLNKISTLNLKKVFVRDLFENIYQLMHPTLEAKNIELEIILKDPNIQVEVDTNLMEQALINLVVNAIEAVKDMQNPKIHLSALSSPTQQVEIKVSDNGCGIPEDVLDKIFIPFFSTRKSGSGIGLSLCKQIMMLHKGTIQVQSTVRKDSFGEGVGTVFSLQF